MSEESQNSEPNQPQDATRKLRECAVILAINTHGFVKGRRLDIDRICALSKLMAGNSGVPTGIRVDSKLGPIDALMPEYQLPYPSIDDIRVSSLARQEEIKDLIVRETRRSVLMSPRQSFSKDASPEFFHEF